MTLERYWYFKALESSLDCKKMKPVHPKGNQYWTFIGMKEAEAETPMLWPPDVKKWLTGKDPDAGKDWRREEKGMTEDEMAGWHHRLDGHESQEALGVSDGQGGLACCSPWGRRVGYDWVTKLNFFLPDFLVLNKGHSQEGSPLLQSLPIYDLTFPHQFPSNFHSSFRIQFRGSLIPEGKLSWFQSTIE